MLWIVSIAALIGVWLNVQRRVACFYIWAVTNATWFAVDLHHGIHAQAALQGAYLVLSVYGIWAWTTRRTERLRT